MRLDTYTVGMSMLRKHFRISHGLTSTWSSVGKTLMKGNAARNLLKYLQEVMSMRIGRHVNDPQYFGRNKGAPSMEYA